MYFSLLNDLPSQIQPRKDADNNLARYKKVFKIRDLRKTNVSGDEILGVPISSRKYRKAVEQEYHGEK